MMGEVRPEPARQPQPRGSGFTEPLRRVDPVHHAADSAEQLTAQNIQLILEAERTAQASMTLAERIAARVATVCGSLPSVLTHLGVVSGWVAFNTLPEFAPHFDPYPFALLALMVAVEAVLLAVFILINQKQEARITEQRSHLDLQVNLLAEQENTKMLKMLQSIARQVGAELADDHDLAVLQSATQPEQLLSQIEQASQRGGEEPTPPTP